MKKIINYILFVLMSAIVSGQNLDYIVTTYPHTRYSNNSGEITKIVLTKTETIVTISFPKSKNTVRISSTTAIAPEEIWSWEQMRKSNLQ